MRKSPSLMKTSRAMLRVSLRLCCHTLPVLSALLISSCSSCEVPREPVLPADLTGRWVGSYTLFDGVGRALTDSLEIELDSDRGRVSGEGTRKRFLPENEPTESQIRAEGTVVVNTFRIDLIDVTSLNRATFSGKVEGDTLAGTLAVDGQVMGELRMVGYRGVR